MSAAGPDQQERLRIALVHPFSWPEVRRGGERYLDDLATYLRGEGHHVEVITGTDGRSELTQRSDGVPVHRLRHPAAGWLGRHGVSKVDAFGVRALPRLLRGRFDLVHALTPSAALASWLTRTPTVYTVLGHPTAAQVGVRRFDATLMRAALRRASASFALSAASAAATVELFGVEVGVLPPGTRLDRFPPSTGGGLGPPRVLFSAAVDDPRKRLDLVLEALGILLERQPDVRLELSGSGDPGPALERVTRNRAAVLAGVDRLGPGLLDDVPLRYREATVTVLPSRDEAFGLVLVESLASGTPVVCTAEGGMPEIVNDARIGRVVRPDDPDALASAIGEAVSLAADPATAARCVAHAQPWGWEAVGARHEAAYRTLLAAGRR